MKTINKDIFEGNWDGMVHCCNLYHCFGGGIAAEVLTRFPQAYEADKATPKWSEDKLGRFSCAKDLDRQAFIFNLYGQVGVGPNERSLNRNLQYDCLYDGVYRICEYLIQESPKNKKLILAFPYGIGCGLAGGNWRIASVVLEEVEKKFPQIEFVIYKL